MSACSWLLCSKDQGSDFAHSGSDQIKGFLTVTRNEQFAHMLRSLLFTDQAYSIHMFQKTLMHNQKAQIHNWIGLLITHPHWPDTELINVWDVSAVSNQ